MRRPSITRRPAEGRPRGSMWALFRRTVGLFRPYRWQFLLLVALLSVTTALDLVAVRLLGAMVDEMMAGGSAALSWLFVAFLGMVLGSALLGVAQAYVNQEIGQQLMVRLRSDLHRHIQRHPV